MDDVESRPEAVGRLLRGYRACYGWEFTARLIRHLGTVWWTVEHPIRDAIAEADLDTEAGVDRFLDDWPPRVVSS